MFRPPGWRPRAAWERPAGHKDKRLRGRAGQRQRALVLGEEPLCRLCARQGKRVRAEVVDHVLPLSQGGGNERANLQALCVPCHDAKSKAERTSGR